MEAHLADWIRDTQDGREAESILRTCVHCGFCNATCPTYQLRGDELDGPRGRIYQIKQVLEGAGAGTSTQLHLDRCLTCMNCETTCPSGVRYGRLLAIGRTAVDARVKRPASQRWSRRLLRGALTRRWIFDNALRIARAFRSLLPRGFRDKVAQQRAPGAWPKAVHARKVLLPDGCVQPALLPSIDAATARVLDALGVQAIVARRSGCCGALDHHLNAHAAALAAARRNIDAWWPHIEAGVEAIVSNASGCGAMLKDYANLLRDDVAYAGKGACVAAMTCDLVEFLAPQTAQLLARVRVASPAPRIAFHPPCTLQHAQKIRGRVEGLLTALGAQLVPVADAHLCCGSAGTYSLLQPELSAELRTRKLADLQRDRPGMILSANIGCLTHLESAAGVPVRHWIEWVDELLGS